MTHEANFISHALRCISNAVSDILGRTELNVRTDAISQRLARRTRAQLKALEQMLRRVIMLIAIGLAKNHVPSPGAQPRLRWLDGIALAPVRAPKAPKGPGPLRLRVPMLPAPRCTMSDVDFGALPKGKPAKPVNIRKLIKRIQTLQAVLENPQPMARHLAAHYARLKALHVQTLPVPPDIPLKRAPAELALVAGALPLEITRARRAWNDSG